MVEAPLGLYGHNTLYMLLMLVGNVVCINAYITDNSLVMTTWIPFTSKPMPAMFVKLNSTLNNLVLYGMA
jgi:hypothetical protein